jgi:hypothetical protein
LQRELAFELEVIDIDDPGFEDRRNEYGDDIPVVHLNGLEVFRHRVNERELRNLITQAIIG